MMRFIENQSNRAKRFAATASIVALFVHSAIAEPPTNKLDWWSFKHAAKPAVPVVPEGKWTRNALDRFILAKLIEHKLVPSPDAERRTLLRRVTFDLVGLPPTPEEVTAFVTDTNTNAFEKIVERLLASPRYGERWARHWLDTVHYGETHGYDKDKPRLNAWPYRDYVIRSFNSDKPYSRFVEEQLAADVLFPDEPELIPALGFIAAGPWDFVGHVELPITKTDGLIARYNDRDDMVMNAMSTFQSLTVHCARCHDHKFDPISAKDYYGLQAVFAGVDRADRPFDADAAIAKQRREVAGRIAELRAQRARLDAELSRIGGDELRALDARIAETEETGEAERCRLWLSQPDQPHARRGEMGAGGSGRVPREIDRLVFVGCHDDFNNIGAGFGFPVRYKIEVSRRRGVPHCVCGAGPHGGRCSESWCETADAAGWQDGSLRSVYRDKTRAAQRRLHFRSRGIDADQQRRGESRSRRHRYGAGLHRSAAALAQTESRGRILLRCRDQHRAARSTRETRVGAK